MSLIIFPGRAYLVFCMFVSVYLSAFGIVSGYYRLLFVDGQKNKQETYKFANMALAYYGINLRHLVVVAT